MSDSYYDGLTGHPDPVRAAGWRHPLGQAARFEAALAPVRAGDRLLDLGCGPGALFGYLRARGPAAEYLGVDVLPAMIARARADHPGGAYLLGDARSLGGPRAEVVVAVGALVTGASLANDGVRLGSLRTLAERAWALAEAAVVLVVLKQEVVEARPALAGEPALGGARVAEARWIAAGLGAACDVRDDVLASDRAIYLWRDPTRRSSLPAEGFAARALSGPRGQGADGFAEAWLWHLAGDAERAEAALARGDFPETAETRWLRDAIRVGGA